MIERLGHYAKASHKSGKPMSQKQKLLLFNGSQVRTIKMLQSHLHLLAMQNPGIKIHVWDALRAIAQIEQTLKSEYERDFEALKQLPKE